MSLDKFIAHALLTWMCCLAWSLPAEAYQERLILSITEGHCTVRVEADDQAHALRLRVQPEAPGCVCSQQTLQTVLQGALAQTDREKPDDIFVSLFLGRLVDYPWLAQRLATAALNDPRWNRRGGRPVSGHANSYVHNVLFRPDVVALFNEALEAGGYRVTGLEVEKVLVCRWEDQQQREGVLTKSTAKVPCDAMVWLVLGKQKPPVGEK